MSIAFFGLFMAVAAIFGLLENPLGTVKLFSQPTAAIVAITLLVINLLVGCVSLINMKDSWRVGVPEDHRTDLIEAGIYRYSRNPYFLSYLIMFAAYTVLLQNLLLLILSGAGFAMIHCMVLKEERHLMMLHGDKYRQYKQKVPRYIIPTGIVSFRLR